MIIADAVILNDVLNKAEFKNLSYESFVSLMELKLLLSKIDENKSKFILQSFQLLSYDFLEPLEENSLEYKEAYLKVMTDLNLIVLKYVTKEVDLNISSIDKKDLYNFCNSNSFNGKSIEILYNLFI